MTKSAIARPKRSPAASSVRKCTPAYTLLRLASCSAAPMESNVRTTPGTTSDVTGKWNWFTPRNIRRTDAPPALITAWAPGYDGSAAVLPTSGSQVASEIVNGLLSASPLQIAVSGRQRLYVYLAS